MILRRLIATGLGSGYAPVASGTFGSAVGIGLFWLAAAYGPAWAPATGFVIATAAGWWAASDPERHFGSHDPSVVVIDEIAGQFLTLLLLPLNWRVLLAGFLLFRLFDIVKPFPARRLESLPGASGIMADDLMAAIYANLVLQVLVRLLPDWFAGT